MNVRLHNKISKRVFPRECFQESVSKKSALDLIIDTYNDKTDLRRIKLTVVAF